MIGTFPLGWLGEGLLSTEQKRFGVRTAHPWHLLHFREWDRLLARVNTALSYNTRQAMIHGDFLVGAVVRCSAVVIKCVPHVKNDTRT